MKQYTSSILLLILVCSLVSVYFLFRTTDTTPLPKNTNTYEFPIDTAFSNNEEITEERIDDIERLESQILPFITNTKDITMPQVRIETTKGTITVELYAEDAPKTVENFLSLTKDGYYDGVIFHRVISGFMIQGGDPTGTGTGGPGYRFEDELNPATESYKRGYVRGTLAMANAGPNTNGSQFFIMHQDYPLPNAYTIFGQVVEGIEVVDAIAASTVNRNDRPLEDIVMNRVIIIE
jgi:cyclophilin family peptidyl-prolyl cis-trans isomerase